MPCGHGLPVPSASCGTMTPVSAPNGALSKSEHCRDLKSLLRLRSLKQDVEETVLHGIDPALNADLLYVLQAMGHGDDLVICDAIFPADSIARQTTYGRL